MSTFRVVEHFYILKDFAASLNSCSKYLFTYQLFFDRFKKALSNRIIITVWNDPKKLDKK